MTAETTLSWSDIYDFLKVRPRLASWPQAEVEQLARDVVVIDVPTGGLVFDTSYQADDAYLVYSGQVRQSVASAQGIEWWHRTLSDGEFFTQQALFRGASYASTAKAEIASILLRVSAPESVLSVRRPARLQMPPAAPAAPIQPWQTCRR